MKVFLSLALCFCLYLLSPMLLFLGLGVLIPMHLAYFKKVNWDIAIAVTCAISILAISLYFYQYRFAYNLLTVKDIDFTSEYFKNIPLSEDQAHWGTFGDFFGGVMNPILGFINLILLTITLSLQRKDTKTQEISARIVAIGHLLDITSQQIKHLSEHSHLLKDDETKLLKNLNANYKIHLEELDKAYNDLKNLKQDVNNGTH